MNPIVTACHAGLLTVFLTLPSTAQEKIERLLDRSPAPANAIGYINLESLERLMPNSGFPPHLTEHVHEFWFIADLDLSLLRPKWEAGYAILSQPVDPQTLADRIGGYVDEIEGVSVTYSPSQAYLVPGEENRLGILRPADRTLLAGWLSPHVTVNYSNFLTRHASQPESYLSLMLAIDLKHAFSPVPLAERLTSLKSLKAKSPQTVASTLASIEGVSVIVGRRGLQECIARFEFSKSPAALQPIAPELLAEIMANNGTAAPEVLTWSAKTEDHALSLQGEISEATLSGLLGIFSLQGSAGQAVTLGDSGAEQTEKQQQGYRSKYYFDEVNQIVDTTRQHQSQTSGALAIWNDQRARQIDELGTLNVDPEVVQFGSNVAELLRGNALTVREGNIEAGKIKTVQGAGGYYGSGYGYGLNAYGVARGQRVTEARARGNAYANYHEALNQIDKLTADLRRAMTEKYQMQF